MNEDQELAATVTECLKIRDRMRADGSSQDECDQYLEQVLRRCWPYTREWKYLCDACADTGLQISSCSGDATCGRAKPHLPHDFGKPCWCGLGARFKDRPPTSDDAVTAAASTKRGFSRAGR